MFEYKIPLFNPAPLGKEILDSMRDIALLEQAARYVNYSDGILFGCGLFERSMNIGVGSGLVKFGGKVYVLMDNDIVPYQPTDNWTVLKIRFGTEEKTRDFLRSTGRLILDENTNILPNEIELGRFKLKQGSSLRTEYVDFQDMTTEYDTVNLINIPYAGIGEPTLSPIILSHFAGEAFPNMREALDMSFCCACLANNGVMSRESIYQYLRKRLDVERKPLNNTELHRYLAQILAEIRGTKTDNNRRDDAEGIMLF